MNSRGAPSSCRAVLIISAAIALFMVPVLPIGVGVVVAAPICDPTTPTTCTLRQLADLVGIRIGSTAESSETADPTHSLLLAREFNSLTPENAMKWYATQAAPGTWTFADADAVVEFAGENAMEVRGHTLVWAQDTYTPAWVRALSDPSQLRAAMESQITTVMNHFAGSVNRWDVVNEPLASLGTAKSSSVFWSLGDEWIADAFTLADSIDPDAELWLNEYGSDWVPGKHEALLALVAELVDAGVPIDGVGIQTHRLPGAVLDTDRFASQLRDFTALGLDVAITELDVPVAPTDLDAFTSQATEYERVVSTCLAVARCVEVTIWGLSDGSTWLDSLGLFPTPTRPLLFDASFAPKPAYEAVRRVLAEAASPTAPPTTGPDAHAEEPEPALPVTGTMTGPLLAAAVLLLVAGVILVRSAQRMRIG